MLIATRELMLDGESGTETVPIRIFMPERDGVMGPWTCRYEIGWPEKVRMSHAYGEDGVQAIELALQKIRIELYTSDYHRTGRLR